MSLFVELKRRNVFRVAIAYIVLSWLVLQMGDLLFDLMGLPEWALRIVLGILALGFIPALVVSWVYELTPEGVKRESEVDRSQSITPHTGRRLDVTIVVMLTVAIALFGMDRVGLFDEAAQEQIDSVRGDEPAPQASSDVIETDSDSKLPRSAGGAISIAVLPFANLSGDDAALPFTNGLHDDLLTQLARINGLKVISRTSVLEYRGTTKNMRTIGGELGVSHLVEGGVQRAGDRVRINAQLIDSITDEHLWADTFDRDLTVENIFEIQTEIASQIARALKINLSIDSQPVFGRPTENLQAYEAYMRGRAGLDNSDYLSESMRGVMADFEEAIRLDPDFAEAHARLALATDIAFWFGGRNTGLREQALKHAQRAMELRPDLPEAYQALASIHYHGYLDYDRALEMLSKAEESMAGEVWPKVTKGAIIRRSGDVEGALKYFLEALELNPRGPLMHADLMGTYMALGRWDDARDITRRLATLPVPAYWVDFRLGILDWNQSGDGQTMVQAIDRFGPVEMDGSWILMPELLAALWSERGDEGVLSYLEALQREGVYTHLSPAIVSARFQPMTEALRESVEQALNEFQARVLSGDQEPDLRMQIAEALIHLGRDDEARRLLATLLSDPVVTRDRFEGGWWSSHAAPLFARLGDLDSAIDALNYALSLNQSYCLRALMGKPGMDVLESHPGFQALVDQYGWTREDQSRGVGL